MAWILPGKEVIICIARLDPPLKGRDCGELPFMRRRAMEDKRGQKREHLSSEAKIKRPGSVDVIDAKVMNITDYGLGIYTSTPLKTDERIIVSIILHQPEKMTRSEDAPGIVRWVQRIKKIYSIGISFETKLNEKEFPIFTKCLEYTKLRR
jgi:hypothetical protein